MITEGHVLVAVRSVLSDEKKLSFHRTVAPLSGHQPLELLADVLGGFNRSSQHPENGVCEALELSAFSNEASVRP
jgi:hypothetical protein